MAPVDNALGDFLQARRAQVDPQDVGLPEFGRRRVRGLRREEVSLLAGVSATYYARLEQGRDHHPSAEVVEAIAAALRLDSGATRYLHELAATAPTAVVPPAERVRPQLQQLLDRHVDTPAYVLGRHLDVLAANRLANALHVSFHAGRNFVRDVFLDEQARAGYQTDDLVATMAHGAALLRASAGPGADEPRLQALVDELTTRSDTFRELWERHEVADKLSGTKRFQHPVLGPVQLDYESFGVRGAEGQLLVVCHAAPDSEAADWLAALAGVALPA
jgi:hypothetical protein